MAKDLEFVQLLLQLCHGVLEPGSLEDGFVSFAGGLDELLRELCDGNLPLFVPGQGG